MKKECSWKRTNRPVRLDSKSIKHLCESDLTVGQFKKMIGYKCDKKERKELDTKKIWAREKIKRWTRRNIPIKKGESKGSDNPAYQNF